MYKYNVGDIVIVKHSSLKEPTRCRIVDIGLDENNIVWYSCTPLEFYFPREFTENHLSPVLV